MGKKGIIIRVVITLLFLTVLFYIENGTYGSKGVASYNDGFGTVDMKNYDVQTVHRALLNMSEEGMHVYKMYYLVDYIFVIFFGMFQTMLMMDLYKACKNKLVKCALIFIPILRAICDIIENIIIQVTLYTYQTVNKTAITVSSRFTAMKLLCIKIWVVALLVGIILLIIRKHHGSKNNERKNNIRIA